MIKLKLKYLRTNKSIIKFILTLAIIGIIVGVIIFITSSNQIKDGVISKLSEIINTITNSKQNNIIYHLIILSIGIILSLTVIGIPIILFYYFYEFASIGYLLASFYKYKGLNGLLFGSIFVIINKILFLILITYFLVNSINYSKRILNNLKGSKSTYIINMLYKGIFVLIITLLNDIILFFIGNKLIGLFISLI